MGVFDEKEAIYEQMKMLIQERRELTKAYYELKEQINKLNEQKAEKEMINQNSRTEKTDLSQEIEHQKYILSQKNKQATRVSYQDLGLDIASFLKEAGVPVSTKRIYEMIKGSHKYELSYSNLISNVLPKINQDSSINIERAYRGYWQYRKNNYQITH